MTATVTMNRQLVLARRPTGLPSRLDFAELDEPVPSPAEGQLLLRTLVLSIDPAMRGWVRDDVLSYLPPVAVGQVMRSYGLAQVVESHVEGFQPGDLVVARTGWQAYAVLDPSEIQRTIDPSTEPLSAALGVLGISGLTAYIGMIDIGRPTPGATVLVSTAAGSVGATAGQLARISGARVVGMTGSEEKRDICLDEFGFDACINYRAAGARLADAIEAECPAGVDVYFDNVGGPMLDAAIANMNVGGRVALCGTIGVDGPAPAGAPRLERKLVIGRLLLQGFLATDHLDRFDEIVDRLSSWLRAGRLRHREDVAAGLGSAPVALERLLAGENAGKSVVYIADPT
jgi:NADPH-dependent curcumin reductase CurA